MVIIFQQKKKLCKALENESIKRVFYGGIMDKERTNNSSWCCDRIEELIKEFTQNRESIALNNVSKLSARFAR